MTKHGEMSLPQCSLGFFPDAGAGYFLGSIEKNIGTFMGMTGIPFNYEECNRRGFITHCTKWETAELRDNLIVNLILLFLILKILRELEVIKNKLELQSHHCYFGLLPLSCLKNSPSKKQTLI